VGFSLRCAGHGLDQFPAGVNLQQLVTDVDVDDGAAVVFADAQACQATEITPFGGDPGG
jgi:hypothetical protein